MKYCNHKEMTKKKLYTFIDLFAVLACFICSPVEKDSKSAFHLIVVF